MHLPSRAQPRRSSSLVADTRTRSTTTGARPPGNGTRTDKPNKQRPLSIETERALLHGALLSSEARDVLATVPGGAWAYDKHGHIAASITTLHLDGQPVDTITVAAHLERQGLLEHVGGGHYIVELWNLLEGSASAAHKYADTLAELYQRWRKMQLGEELTFAALTGLDTDLIVAELLDINNTVTASSWDEIDLEPIVTGDQLTRPPTMLHRDDGQALIYPGEIHAFNAPSEAGKSWLALAACVEELNTGAHVVYIDLEDSPEGITERLTALGAHLGLLYGPDRLFHYVRPDDPIDPTGITRLVRLDPSLVVIDGVTEAMSMNGFSIKDNDDIAVFLKVLPRVFARAGAAVILIDHVVKNKDERGDDAIGGQHKRAGIAASYKLETLRPFGRNMGGASRIITTKDRFGHVRAGCAGGRTVGELRLVSSGNNVTLTIAAPQSIIDPDAGFRPTMYMQRVSEAVEHANTAGVQPAANDLKKLVSGKHTIVHRALELLVAEGYLDIKVGARNTHHHLAVRPYREIDDPASPLHSTTDSGEQEEVEQF